MGEYGTKTFYLFVDFKPPMTALIKPNSSRLWINFKFLENIENWRSPCKTQGAR
jgi:hypothetical protein